MFDVRLGMLKVLAATGILFAVPGFAQDINFAGMITEIDKRLLNYTAKQEAIKAGQERAVLCKSCHGEDGNSSKPDVPNLAGQNAGYLLDQIDRFADGRRKDFIMNQLAEEFTTEDKINLAIFYHSMPVQQQQVNWHLANKGEAIYKIKCTSCHGEEGLGQNNLARLAGQRVEYVKKVLNEFRNAANQGGAQSESRRVSPTMERVAKSLTNEQIDELAAYVGQLGVEDLD